MFSYIVYTNTGITRRAQVETANRTFMKYFIFISYCYSSNNYHPEKWVLSTAVTNQGI